MAWLNLNKEFDYFYYEKVDYEEEFDWDFNWCLDPTCPCDKQWDGDYSKLTINPDPMACDNYPFREGFRTRELLKQGWDFKDNRSTQKVGNISKWDYALMVAENNIGKRFDKAFSYYLKRAKHVYDRHHIFLKMFEECRKYRDFFIDDVGNIQYGDWMKRYRNKSKSKTPYVFNSADFSSKWVDKRTGYKLPKNYWKLTGNHEEWVDTGYQVRDVIPNSKLEKRLRWEYIQKRKQMDREYQLYRKSIQYDWLTDAEKLEKTKLC